MTDRGLPRPGDYDFETAVAQLPVVSAAWDFLTPFYESGDLAQGWSNMDPVLQLCWAQWWLDANRTEIEREGLVVADVAVALRDDGPDHELWPHFQRVVTRDFRNAFPANPRTWGIGAAPRPMAPDIELLYVHPEVPAGGVWQPGEAAWVIPLVMHLVEQEWKVLNLGAERVPEPGWPPRLFD